jgi:hypothetical protein
MAAVAAVLLLVLAAAPAARADVNVSVDVTVPPAVAPHAGVPIAFAPPWPYGYLPPYPYVAYPPAAFFFGSAWDPDYRAIRYNHYFQRHQPEPRIRGYTLGR